MPLNVKKIININNGVGAKILAIFSRILFQPLFLLIHITLDCNLRCNFCYQKRDEFYKDKNKQLSAEQFAMILDDVRQSFFFKPRLHLFGGEPLASGEFSAIIRAAGQKKFKTSLTTNGILLGKYASEIIDAGIGQINVSLDGLDATHDILRGRKGIFEKVMGNIKFFLSTAKKKNKRIIININSLITKENCDSLFDFAKYFEDNNIDIDTITFQHAYYFKQTPEIDDNVLADELSRFGRCSFRFPILIIPNIKSREDLTLYYQGKLTDGQCHITQAGMNILPNLDITPAGGVLGCNRVIGNLAKRKIKDIWRGDELKNFQKTVLAGKLPDACYYCCHRKIQKYGGAKR